MVDYTQRLGIGMGDPLSAFNASQQARLEAERNATLMQREDQQWQRQQQIWERQDRAYEQQQAAAAAAAQQRRRQIAAQEAAQAEALSIFDAMQAGEDVDKQMARFVFQNPSYSDQFTQYANKVGDERVQNDLNNLSVVSSYLKAGDVEGALGHLGDLKAGAQNSGDLEMAMEVAELERAVRNNPQAASFLTSMQIAGLRGASNPEEALALAEFETGLGGGGEMTEAEAEIQRLQSIGIDRDTAIKIKEGVLKANRDPVTGETTIIDMTTGATVGQVPQGSVDPNAVQETVLTETPEVEKTPESEKVPEQFGDEGGDVFGARGFLINSLNKAADIAGMAPPNEEALQAKSDFDLFNETLLIQMAQARSGGGRPTQASLDQLRKLLPTAASIFEGPESAQTKLLSIKRDMESIVDSTDRSLRRKLTPTNRENTLSKNLSAQSAIETIDRALASFNEAEVVADDELQGLLDLYSE